MLHTYSESIDSFGDKAYRGSLGSEVGKRVDKSLTLEATQRKIGWRSLSKKMMDGGPGSRWGSREQGSVFPWQRACYWQSGFSGEVAQKPPYSRLRREWTRTGGRSEGGQLFQEVWEELRMWNSIFYRKSDLNEFNQRKVFFFLMFISWCLHLFNVKSSCYN